MASWKHTEIIIDGQPVKAQAPIIVSASRSTDIPAFYADWFFDRLEKGYSAWTNPFNGVKSYVSYEQTRFIVFWSVVNCFRTCIFVILKTTQYVQCFDS